MEADASMNRPLVIEVRIEWNLGRTKVVWTARDNHGTQASGFSACHADAMRDATAFVEALAQPRVGSAFQKAGLRIVK